MRDEYFYLKNYRLYHDERTVKITTDSVLLGALVNESNRYERILDIGCGCGIIMFIMADRFGYSIIEGVEVDSYSCEIAERNIKENNLGGRIRVYNCSVEEFVKYYENSYYDLIVCNPPYYNSSFLSGNIRRDGARQDNILSIEVLMNVVSKVLSDTGFFYFIYPYKRFSEIYKVVNIYGYHIREMYKVGAYKGSDYNRIILGLSKQYGEVNVGEMFIRNDVSGSYTEEYIRITKDILRN